MDRHYMQVKAQMDIFGQAWNQYSAGAITLDELNCRLAELNLVIASVITNQALEQFNKENPNWPEK